MLSGKKTILVPIADCSVAIDECSMATDQYPLAIKHCFAGTEYCSGATVAWEQPESEGSFSGDIITQFDSTARAGISRSGVRLIAALDVVEQNDRWHGLDRVHRID